MDRITMLGTGHAMTLDCFNTCFVYENENGKMLVDTGGGQQLLRQLRDAGISSREIQTVFISHQHTDHLLGLPWLFRTLGGPGGGDRKLTLYMHEELMGVATGILRLLLPDNMSRLGKSVQFIPVKTGDTAEIAGRMVRFFDLYSPNVTQYGFSMILGNGEKLVFHGDVPFDARNRGEIQGAEYLLHEAFQLESEKLEPPFPGAGEPLPGMKKPGGMGHSTVREAASYAESLGVKNLILFHGSDRDLANRKKAYTAEARQAFQGNIFVPNDLDVIDLNP